MKLNIDKYSRLISGRKHQDMCAKIGQDIAWESSIIELLKVTIGNHLKFDN